MFILVHPHPTNTSSHIKLTVFAHVVGIALGPTGIRRQFVFHAFQQRSPILDALSLLHTRQKAQGGLGAGFRLMIRTVKNI